MKFLFLDDRLPNYLHDKNYPVGGASVRVLALASGLAELGHEVGIMTWMGANKKVGKSLPFKFIEAYNLDSKVKGLRFFSRRIKMYKAAKSYNPDVILQISAAVNTGVMGIISRKLGIPFIYLAASNADADDKYKSILGKWEQVLYRHGIRSASMIIAQNEYQKRCFLERFPDKPISIIHNPFYYPWPLPDLKPFNERHYVAWVGNFAKVKNVPAATDIIGSLPHIQFKLAGNKTNKTDAPTLAAMEKLKEMENVEFVGHLARNEVVPFLSEALALFNTSNLEGFSNTFLESLAVGTPIITRKDIDPDHILEKNNLGEIVNENSEIATAIRNLINITDYDQYSNRCRNYLTKNHDNLYIAEKLVKAVKPLI